MILTCQLQELIQRKGVQQKESISSATIKTELEELIDHAIFTVPPNSLVEEKHYFCRRFSSVVWRSALSL